MTTFTEIVATVVVHSSAVALSHFGMAMEPTQTEKAQPAPVERVVARTHVSPAQSKVLKLTSCPQKSQPTRPIRA